MAKFQLQTHLKAIICPTAEFHHTRLFVEWKVLDIDFAGALINRRWPPLDAPRIVESGLCGQRHFEIAIGAVSYKAAAEWCGWGEIGKKKCEKLAFRSGHDELLYKADLGDSRKVQMFVYIYWAYM